MNLIIVGICVTNNCSFLLDEDKKEREKDMIRHEMIPTERKNLTFWSKLYELQYKMLFNNQVRSSDMAFMCDY